MLTLIKYIYTHQIDFPGVTRAIKLFTAADKYDIKPLKVLCCKMITENVMENNWRDVLELHDLFPEQGFAEEALYMAGKHIDSDNIIELLEIAVRYEDEVLRDNAIAYLSSDKCPKISELDGYKKLPFSTQTLITETIIDNYRKQSNELKSIRTKNADDIVVSSDEPDELSSS